MFKNKVLQQDLNNLLPARDVYRLCGSGESVCIVIPDNATPASVFGTYYRAMASRLARPSVCVVNLSDLSNTHLRDYTNLVDMCVEAPVKL